MSRDYEIKIKADRNTSQTNRWLAEQGINPDRLGDTDYAADLGRLLELKPLWSYVVEQDRAQWLGLWYRVYKRNKPLTETHKLYFRNILKRAKRLSKRK